MNRIVSFQPVHQATPGKTVVQVTGSVTDLWVGGQRVFHSDKPVEGLELTLEVARQEYRVSATWEET